MRGICTAARRREKDRNNKKTDDLHDWSKLATGMARIKSVILIEAYAGAARRSAAAIAPPQKVFVDAVLAGSDEIACSVRASVKRRN
jgi:hypothetical protein